jgi:hypothetical protein
MKLYSYTYIIIKMEKIQERTMFILNEIVVRANFFYSDRSSINLFSESSLNIKVDKRWIPFVRNWISNFTVVQ